MIDAKWVKNLPGFNPNLVNGSNCDNLHNHLTIRNTNNSNRLLFENDNLNCYIDNQLITTFDSFGTQTINSLVLPPTSDLYVTANGNIKNINGILMMIDDNHQEWLSIAKYNILAIYNGLTSSSTNTYYHIVNNSSGGVLISNDMRITNITMRLGQYIASTRRRQIQISKNGSIIWSSTPPFSSSDRSYIEDHLDITFNANDYFNIISSGVGGTSSIDRWGYFTVFVTYSFRGV